MSKSVELNPSLVSVIIPTYNRPVYMKEALQSAVQQTYCNIEIIVSDNCSPENPQAIVESFQDPRIRFYRHSTNLGLLANAIGAFKQARGRYVASLSDDDVWEATFLEKLVPFLEVNPDVSLAFCDHYIINSEGKIDMALTEACSQATHRSTLSAGIYRPFTKLGIIDSAVSPAMAAVIRREVINWDEISPDVGVTWDLYLNYLCSRSGQGAYYYPEKLTRVREHIGGDSRSYKRENTEVNICKLKNHLFCYERFLEDDRLSYLKPILQNKWAYYMTSIGINLLRAQQPAAARSYILKALRQQPSLRSIVALMLSFTPSAFARQF